MNSVLIFRHIECEGPGYFAEFLQRQQIPFTLICIDRNEPIPEQLGNSSGLVFMGGNMSVNDDLPWIEQELQLIRQAVAANIPVLGHCLGGQLISKAMGGTVTKNPIKELGWHAVNKSAAKAPVSGTPASNQRWFDSVPDNFEAFHWHGETFSLPEGATALLENKQCKNQAFFLNNTLALQCHVEMTSEMVKQWVTLYKHELDEPGSHIQSSDEILANLEQRILAMQTIADALYTAWVKPIIEKN